MVRRALKRDFYVLSDKCFTCCEDPVEQFDKTLALRLRDRLADGQADYIPMPDQLLICGVDQHESVFGTLKERRKARQLANISRSRRTCSPASTKSKLSNFRVPHLAHFLTEKRFVISIFTC